MTQQTPSGPGNPTEHSDQPVVRPATEADVETIHRLVLDLAASMGKDGRVASSADDIRRGGFGAAPVFEALIAEWHGRAVGLCLYFDSFSTWDGRRGVYIQDLYVAESARGHGLGRRLLAEAVRLSHARGATYLRLSVDAENIAAQAFYDRIGLHWSSMEKIYQVRDDDFTALLQSTEDNGT